MLERAPAARGGEQCVVLIKVPDPIQVMESDATGQACRSRGAAASR